MSCNFNRGENVHLYKMFPNIYRGTEGTSRNLNTFFKLMNLTVDSTVTQAFI